jgi:enoyl-CoA hydratase/carnithine racemase
MRSGASLTDARPVLVTIPTHARSPDMTAHPHPVEVLREGAIAVVSLRSGGRANPLTLEAMHALNDTALSLGRDPSLSAVVLHGSEVNFTYGFDLVDAASVAKLPLAERREALSIGPRMCSAWERIEALTVLAIEGWCVGGGVALGASLDLRVAGRSATLYVPEIERGMNMSWGALPRLINLIGPARTKRLVMLAQKVPATVAAEWGLVDEVTDDGRALDRAMDLARQAEGMPPVQLRMCKLGIDAYATALAGVAAALDRDQYLLAQATADHSEGVSAFLEKRAPRWTGR